MICEPWGQVGERTEWKWRGGERLKEGWGDSQARMTRSIAKERARLDWGVKDGMWRILTRPLGWGGQLRREAFQVGGEEGPKMCCLVHLGRKREGWPVIERKKKHLGEVKKGDGDHLLQAGFGEEG